MARAARRPLRGDRSVNWTIEPSTYLPHLNPSYTRLRRQRDQFVPDHAISISSQDGFAAHRR
jgi:hypothetical protein